MCIPDETEQRRIGQAAQYLIDQHGDAAAAEAEKALAHAVDLNDERAIETFTSILTSIREAAEREHPGKRNDPDG